MKYGLIRLLTGEIRIIETLTELLTTLERAYEGAALFDTALFLAATGLSGEFPHRPADNISLSMAVADIQARWGDEKYVRRQAPSWESSRNILIASIQMTSPGFWSFLGSINPLEVLRQYLNDRHQRKLDDQYRSQADRRRLELQNAHDLLLNMKLENEIVSSRLELAKMAGAAQHELRKFVDLLVVRPMEPLMRIADTVNLVQIEPVTPVPPDWLEEQRRLGRFTR